MKILHIEDNFCPTMGYQLNAIAKWNKIHGHQVTILSSKSLEPWQKSGFIESDYNLENYDKKYMEKYGVKIKRIRSYKRISGREIMHLPLIFSEVINGNYDIVFVHGIETVTSMYLLLKIKQIMKNTKIVFDSHMVRTASINRLSGVFYSVYRLVILPIIQSNDLKVIAVSDATKSFLTENLSIPLKLIDVITLGTDPSVFKRIESGKDNIRSKMGIDANEIVYIYSGKISKNKKVALLSEAFDRIIRNTDRKMRLFIAGTGNDEYAKEVLNYFKNQQWCTLLGTISPEKLNYYYNISDFAIWPGASSLSFYDAQYVGLPAILEDIDINLERLSTNNGYTYHQDSIESLIEIIMKTMNIKKNDYDQMSMNARNYVSKEYTYDVISSQYESYAR